MNQQIILILKAARHLLKTLTKFPGAVILVSHDFHLLSLVSTEKIMASEKRQR